MCIRDRLVQGNLRPNLTLVLDIPVEIGLERAHLRSAPDRFEQEEMEFFHRVRNGYLAMAKTYSDRYVVIDASQCLESVQADISNALGDFYRSSKREQP